MKKFRKNFRRNTFISRLRFNFKLKRSPKHFNRRDVLNGYVARGVFQRSSFSKQSYSNGFKSPKFGKSRFFKKIGYKYNFKRQWRTFKQYDFKLKAPFQALNPNFNKYFNKNYLIKSKPTIYFNYISLDLVKLIALSYLFIKSYEFYSSNTTCYTNRIYFYGSRWRKYLSKTNYNYKLSINEVSFINRNIPLTNTFKSQYCENKRLANIFKDTSYFRSLKKKYKKDFFFIKPYATTEFGKFLSCEFGKAHKAGMHISKRRLIKACRRFFGNITNRVVRTLRSRNKILRENSNLNWVFIFGKRNRKRKHIWRRVKFYSKLRFRKRRGYFRRLRVYRFRWWSLLSLKTTAPHKKSVIRKIKGSKKFRRYRWNKNFNVNSLKFKRQFRGLFSYKMLSCKKKRLRENKNFPTIELLARIKTKETSKIKLLRTESLNMYYLFLLKRPYMAARLNFNSNKITRSVNNIKSNNGSVYRNPDFLLNFYLIKFLENRTNNLIYLNIDNKHLDRTRFDSSYMVIANWASNVYKFDRRFNYKIPLFNFCLVLYHSFKTKDLELLSKLLEYSLAKLKLWQHRSFFKFVMFLVECYVSTMFKKFNITGFQFEVKGKISLGGNSRKKKLSLRLRNTFKSNMKVRSQYKFKPLNTVSGALGVKMWVYYV